MNEEEAFKSLFRDYCEGAGLVMLSGYPLYEITDGFSELRVRIVNPFAEAEIENTRKIKKATPKRITEIMKKEFAKRKNWKREEDDVIRFSKVLLHSVEQLLLLVNNPTRIVKIRTLLSLVKHLYSSFKIRVDESDMFSQALNSGLLEFELFPGRDPADFFELTSPEGEKRRYSLIRFKKLKLARN